MHIAADYDHPDRTRQAIGAAVDAGFRHIVLGLPLPYASGAARWAADELIRG
jgi:hypothetical protein